MLLFHSLLSLLLLAFPLFRTISAGSVVYVNYQPAVYIVVANTGPGSSPPPSSGSGSGSSSSSGTGSGAGPGAGAPPSTPPTVPFSPATPPVCPSDHQSCDTVGEPSWCCTTAQHCAFDDGGDVACCPVGDFCRGTVNYGSPNAGGAGSGGGSGGGGAGDGSSTTITAPGGAGLPNGISVGQTNGPVVLSSEVGLLRSRYGATKVFGLAILQGLVALI
jgi:hypothetical protein